tara:strand:- start:2063 stop:2302 length:240 start_codon:yes stop_codon:yes gene_type:complete
MTMYKVVTIDQFGLNVTQEDGFKNSSDAQEEANDCIERWGEQFGQDFWVEPYEPEPYKKPRVYNNNAVDGWEDIYQLEE